MYIYIYQLLSFQFLSLYLPVIKINLICNILLKTKRNRNKFVDVNNGKSTYRSILSFRYRSGNGYNILYLYSITEIN